jgi:flavin reductase (DIM6/NTAB) family NADH-FMN oxidoreductase RutF
MMKAAPLHVWFRRAASFWPTGVALVSAGETVMTVSSLQFLSFDPPLVSLALATDSTKAACIVAAPRFRVRILRATEESMAKEPSGPSEAGLVELAGEAQSVLDAGSHQLLLARADEVRLGEGQPLVYWRRTFHSLALDYPFLADRDVFADFVAQWENGRLPKRAWTHGAHVAVGTSRVVRYGAAAFEYMKRGVIRFNESVGTENTAESGYHETLTRLWIDVIARLVTGFTNEWDAARHAVQCLGEDRDLHTLYYSFDVVRSGEARRRWIPPDLAGPY